MISTSEDGKNPIDELSIPYISSSYANEIIWGSNQNIIVKSEEISYWIEQRVQFLDTYLKKSIIR